MRRGSPPREGSNRHTPLARVNGTVVGQHGTDRFFMPSNGTSKILDQFQGTIHTPLFVKDAGLSSLLEWKKAWFSRRVKNALLIDERDGADNKLSRTELWKIVKIGRG